MKTYDFLQTRNNHSVDFGVFEEDYITQFCNLIKETPKAKVDF